MNSGQYEQSPKVAPTVAIDERAEFEKWFNTQDYSADVRTWAWNGFRAARKLSAPVVPDDYATPIPHDEKRIDFLEAHPELRISKHKRFWSVGTFSNYERDVHKTLREAIDAAMQANCDAMLKGEK